MVQQQQDGLKEVVRTSRPSAATTMLQRSPTPGLSLLSLYLYNEIVFKVSSLNVYEEMLGYVLVEVIIYLTICYTSDSMDT